ncbi:hypothetical protein [Xanthomonas sp. MUS 060]|uniref:hypothetical protein n=1 Tax=Xanthomonas sp. MUS 060 TaxID=1588031 RepID=UPI000A8CF921|nr:hypothetical protein [Xanthomonas sp. MUS 060]
MKIKLGGMLGFGLTFIVWLPLTAMLLRLNRRGTPISSMSAPWICRRSNRMR